MIDANGICIFAELPFYKFLIFFWVETSCLLRCFSFISFGWWAQTAFYINDFYTCKIVPGKHTGLLFYFIQQALSRQLSGRFNAGWPASCNKPTLQCGQCHWICACPALVSDFCCRRRLTFSWLLISTSFCFLHRFPKMPKCLIRIRPLGSTWLK